MKEEYRLKMIEENGGKQYPDGLRPHLLEPYYSRHITAMTLENLHPKSEIAEQLAYRDLQIQGLRDRVAGLEDMQIEREEWRGGDD